MKNRLGTYIYASIICFVVITIIVANIRGNKQDEVYKQEIAQYESGLQLLAESKPQEAEVVFGELYKEHPERYNVTHFLGLAYGMENKFKEAENYYQKALKMRPFLQVNPVFMMQYGQILFANKQYKGAKLVLEKCKALPDSTAYHKDIDQLLLSISAMGNGGK